MKKASENKLNILAQIDEKIIDKQTERRIKLYGRKRSIFYNKVFIRSTAIVAACLLIFLIVIPIMFAKQVPVYEGMTVSNSPPEITAKGRASGGNVLLSASYANILPTWQSFLNSEETEGAGQNTDKLPQADTEKIEEEISDSLDVIGSAEEIYYAKPGEDVYITIHISNPDKFEILSFTLNGVKYSSYMFEEGSDLENLILKCNVGDAEGIIEYTIDQIKYVDGTLIKDVRMEGDKTVRIGIYNENQPTASADNVKIDHSSISFDALTSDPEELVSKYGRSFYAALYDCSTGKVTKVMPIGTDTTTSVKFEELETKVGAKGYYYAIAAVYDAFDGKGMNIHVLYAKHFSNDPTVSFKSVEPTRNDVLFHTESSSSLSKIIKVEAINENGEVVATVTEGNRIYDLPGGAHYLKMTYSYMSDEGEVTCEVKSYKFYSIDFDIRPVNGNILFGYYEGSHSAVDFTPTTTDKNVYSVDKGRVSKIYTHPTYGLTVVITNDFEYNFVYQTLGSVSVSVGDRLNTGDVIGTVGTGSEHEGFEYVHFVLEAPPERWSTTKRPTDPRYTMTDDDKLAFEARIAIRLSEINEKTFELPTSGTIYENVQLSYSTADEGVSIDGNTLTVLTEGYRTITLTTTLTLGEISKTVEHTVEIRVSDTNN